METVAIIGLGLMGSSLGLALKKCVDGPRVHAYARRPETRSTALDIGAADAVFDSPSDAVKDADLVVLCLPVKAIASVAESILSTLSSGMIVTDVGSTKSDVIKQMESLLSRSDAVFVGSHPICGSEQQGIEAADESLYEGAVTVVAPGEDVLADAVKTVCAFWEQIGSTVEVMEPDVHDAILAVTSHLPHMAAAALVRCVDDGLFCGTGFRDTTRIAEGSPEVWRDILMTNREAVLDALARFRKEMDLLEHLIRDNDNGEVESWLAAAAGRRKDLLS
jgi:prephenate dehydrogenase